MSIDPSTLSPEQAAIFSAVGGPDNKAEYTAPQWMFGLLISTNEHIATKALGRFDIAGYMTCVDLGNAFYEAALAAMEGFTPEQKEDQEQAITVPIQVAVMAALYGSAIKIVQDESIAEPAEKSEDSSSLIWQVLRTFAVQLPAALVALIHERTGLVLV